MIIFHSQGTKSSQGTRNSNSHPKTRKTVFTMGLIGLITGAWLLAMCLISPAYSYPEDYPKYHDLYSYKQEKRQSLQELQSYIDHLLHTALGEMDNQVSNMENRTNRLKRRFRKHFDNYDYYYDSYNNKSKRLNKRRENLIFQVRNLKKHIRKETQYLNGHVENEANMYKEAFLAMAPYYHSPKFKKLNRYKKKAQNRIQDYKDLAMENLNHYLKTLRKL